MSPRLSDLWVSPQVPVHCTQPAQTCHDISARECNNVREFWDSSCASLSSTTRSSAGCRLSKRKPSSKARNMFLVMVWRWHDGQRDSSIADPPKKGRDAVMVSRGCSSTDCSSGVLSDSYGKVHHGPITEATESGVGWTVLWIFIYQDFLKSGYPQIIQLWMFH